LLVWVQYKPGQTRVIGSLAGCKNFYEDSCYKQWTTHVNTLPKYEITATVSLTSFHS